MAHAENPNEEPITQKKLSETPIHEPLKKHPWRDTIKNENVDKILRAHNSVWNPEYPDPDVYSNQKPRLEDPNRITFTVLGLRTTKDFIYCVKMVQGMHKYRAKTFAPPIIKGYSLVEWNDVKKEIKQEHGKLAFWLLEEVAVLYDGEFLGGAKELKELIESRYIYHLALNYQKETVEMFREFVESSGRSFAYMHISIGEQPIGCLIFMLYSDICPLTCENFLRLCATKKGGYSGTPVHRIAKDGWIQCGGFGLKESPLGCENFTISHDRRGVLSMCNAGRDIECSTQFFVLLQPAVWMNEKYVAFGQMIEGEETLSRIEEVPTFEESPTEDIIIFKSGILNMECDDVVINKGAAAYIDGHIEDLVSLSEMLAEWIMELVNLEITVRSGEAITEVEGEDNTKNIKPTRSLTKIDAYNVTVARRSPKKTRPRLSPSPKRGGKKDESSNLEFDVEVYNLAELEGEAYSYDQVTPFSDDLIKEKRPYYIPLTDVPYQDEKDSTFDLKRLLQGEYCLEADLDPDQPKKPIESQRSPLLQRMSTYTTESSSSSSDMEDELLEEELEDIEEYIREFVEHVSFSGRIVKHIASKLIKSDWRNAYRYKLNDEEIRRMRLARLDLKDSKVKQVTTTASPWATHSQVKRRQTGYTKKAAHPFWDHDEEEKRDSDDVFEIRGVPKFDESKAIGFAKQGKPKSERSKVRLAKDSLHRSHSKMKSAVFDHKLRSSGKFSEYDIDHLKGRPSVLARLYEDLAIDDLDEPPTLKDYKPKIKKSHHFMLSSKESLRGILLTKSKKVDDGGYKERLSPIPSSYELRKQTSSKQSRTRHRKSKSDFSIRPHEDVKKQPTITVSEYQLKNRIYALQNKTKEEQQRDTARKREKVRELEQAYSPFYSEMGLRSAHKPRFSSFEHDVDGGMKK